MKKIKPITLEIDNSLWLAFKATVKRDKTLNNAIVELIRKEVKNDKNRS